MVSHVAAREAHQRSLEFSYFTRKRLLQQYRRLSRHRRSIASEIRNEADGLDRLRPKHAHRKSRPALRWIAPVKRDSGLATWQSKKGIRLIEDYGRISERLCSVARRISPLAAIRDVWSICQPAPARPALWPCWLVNTRRRRAPAKACTHRVNCLPRRLRFTMLF